MKKIDQTKKSVIKVFKDTGLKIEIKTNLKIVDFLNVTLTLLNGTYSPYKDPKITMTRSYISNHPPQRINQ